MNLAYEKQQQSAQAQAWFFSLPQCQTRKNSRSGKKLKPATIQRRIDVRTARALERWTRDRRHLLPTSMEDVAAELNVSKEQLSHFFRMFYNVSFLRWRKELRIAEAERLLAENPEISLDRLGYEVGIPDKSNMRRQFLEVTGKTPAQWLKEAGKPI